MPLAQEMSTRGRVRPDGVGISSETFPQLHQAIVERQEIEGFLKGWRIRFCPHALGWREDDPYVLGLLLEDGQARFPDGGSSEWLLEWRWLRLADLTLPVARKGGSITCPIGQRPAASAFLTEVEAESD